MCNSREVPGDYLWLRHIPGLLYTGPNTAPADHSKNCQIHLSLKYPGELWYSVLNMTYHGYARLGVGVTGSFYSAYFFSQAAENTVCFAFLTRCKGLSRAMRDLTMSLGKYQSTIPGPELVSGQIYTKNDKVETTWYCYRLVPLRHYRDPRHQ